VAHRDGRRGGVAGGVVLVPRAVEWGRDVGRPAGTVEDALSGTFDVDVADRPRGDNAALVGRWLITFGSEGVLDLDPPPAYAGATAGTAYEVDGQTLSTDALVDRPGCQTSAGTNVGIYRWRVTGAGIRFEVVNDRCQARVELFTGQTWRRAP
jgi:hypothetical protein